MKCSHAVVHGLLLHEVHLARVQVWLARRPLALPRRRLLRRRASGRLPPVLIRLVMLWRHLLLARAQRLLLLGDASRLGDLEGRLHSAPTAAGLCATALSRRHPWRQLSCHLWIGLQQHALLHLQRVDLMLHALELLSHLVALLHSRLQLLTDVHDHLARAFQLLSGVVSRA